MAAEMTVDTSIGDTLICTVGLSPTPVALSVLTLDPDHVVLVCTASTLPVAASIARLVADRSQYRDTAATVAIVELDERDARDLHGIRAALGTDSVGSGAHHGGAAEAELGPPDGTLAAVLRGIGARRPVLDYTGGTSVMVAGVVEFHRRYLEADGVDEEGIRQRRSYVAIANDIMRFDDGTVMPLDDSLDLTERARLHGGQLSGWRRGQTSTAQLSEWARSLKETYSSYRRSGDLDLLRAWLDDFQQHGPFTWAGSHERPQPLFGAITDTSKPADREGSLAEAHAMIQIEHALTVVPGARYHETWINSRVTREGESEEFVEIDVLVRVGNTVIGIESKRSFDVSERAEASLYRLMRSLPVAFGAAVRVLIVPTLRPSPAVADQLSRAADLLGVPEWNAGAVLAYPGPRTVERALTKEGRGLMRAALSEQLARWLPVVRYEPPDPEPVDDHVMPLLDPAAEPKTISGIGGSPLAVLTAALAMEEGMRLTVVGSESLLDTLPQSAPVIPSVSRFDPQSPVAARIALLRAAGASPEVRFVITPGTKAMTAAMVDVAADLERAGRTVDLIHVDAALDEPSTRSGARLAWSHTRTMDWAHVLGLNARRLEAQDPVQYIVTGPGDPRSGSFAGDPDLDALAEAALRQGLTVARAWRPESDAAGDRRTPRLAFLGRRRVIVVSAEAGRDLKTKIKLRYLLESHAISHQFQYGPAARTLFLIDDSSTMRKSLLDLVRGWRGAPLLATQASRSSKGTRISALNWSRLSSGHGFEIEPSLDELWRNVRAFLEMPEHQGPRRPGSR